MKNLLSISLVVVAAALPIASFAQQRPATGPLTRADVRAQSAQAAQDHRMQSKVHYPATQQSANLTRPADTGYGNQPGGSSESRTVPSQNAASSSATSGLFAHH
jgi:type II secretory pathway pseudopilin PulG